MSNVKLEDIWCDTALGKGAIIKVSPKLKQTLLKGGHIKNGGRYCCPSEMEEMVELGFFRVKETPKAAKAMKVETKVQTPQKQEVKTEAEIAPQEGESEPKEEPATEKVEEVKPKRKIKTKKK